MATVKDFIHRLKKLELPCTVQQQHHRKVLFNSFHLNVSYFNSLFCNGVFVIIFPPLRDERRALPLRSAHDFLGAGSFHQIVDGRWYELFPVHLSFPVTYIILFFVWKYLTLASNALREERNLQADEAMRPSREWEFYHSWLMILMVRD